MSVNKYDKDSGELVTLASGSRVWIGTEDAWNTLKSQNKQPKNCLKAVIDDYGAKYGAGNWLRGKKINFMGDSITHGFIGWDNGQEVLLDRSYPDIVARELGCTANNYALAGSTITGGTFADKYLPMPDRLSDMDTDADVNVVMGGTNDWGHNAPLGTFGDTTEDTFYGALDVIAKYLIANFPNAINIFCSPLHYVVTNNTWFAFEEYVYAIKSVANKYGFVFIDTYHNAPMWRPDNATLRARYSVDGTHPNQKYIDDILGQYMTNAILNLDGGRPCYPKDPVYMRELLDLSEYYSGAYVTGSLWYYVEDDTCHISWVGSVAASSGAAPFISSDGSIPGGANYSKDNVTTRTNLAPYGNNSGFVHDWKPFISVNDVSEPIAFWYATNDSVQWHISGVDPSAISSAIIAYSQITYKIRR